MSVQSRRCCCSMCTECGAICVGRASYWQYERRNHVGGLSMTATLPRCSSLFLRPNPNPEAFLHLLMRFGTRYSTAMQYSRVLIRSQSGRSLPIAEKHRYDQYYYCWRSAGKQLFNNIYSPIMVAKDRKKQQTKDNLKLNRQSTEYRSKNRTHTLHKQSCTVASSSVIFFAESLHSVFSEDCTLVRNLIFLFPKQKLQFRVHRMSWVSE